MLRLARDNGWVDRPARCRLLAPRPISFPSPQVRTGPNREIRARIELRGGDMRWRWLLPFMLVWLALGDAVSQSPPAGNSVLPVGLMVIQPTRLPQSLQQFEGQPVFLPIAYGTGFVVREDGYVVTALHVVRKAESRLPEIQASGKQVVVCLNTPAGSPECKEVEVAIAGRSNFGARARALLGQRTNWRPSHAPWHFFLVAPSSLQRL